VGAGQLVFRVQFGPAGCSAAGPSIPIAAVPAVDLGALERTLRAALAAIPAADALTLAGYWRDRSRRPLLASHHRAGPSPRPVLRVVGELDTPGALASCEGLGTELHVRADATRGPAAELEKALAGALVEALLFADYTHWKLAVQCLDGPMEAWLRARKARPTEAQEEKKWAALEQDFLARKAEAADRVLRRWGLLDPPARQG
jgi:hypothetical protein